MRALYLGLAIFAAGCAAKPTDPPVQSATYPVPYDQLADCVIANGDWPGNGFRFIPMPTLGETRITAQGGFNVGTIWSFKRAPGNTTLLEVRATGLGDRLAWIKPQVEACVATLSRSN